MVVNCLLFVIVGLLILFHWMFPCLLQWAGIILWISYKRMFLIVDGWKLFAFCDCRCLDSVPLDVSFNELGLYYGFLTKESFPLLMVVNCLLFVIIGLLILFHWMFPCLLQWAGIISWISYKRKFPIVDGCKLSASCDCRSLDSDPLDVSMFTSMSLDYIMDFLQKKVSHCWWL